MPLFLFMIEVQQVPITKIKPYAKNAKQHPEIQIQKVAESIRVFGFNQPIVVDKNYVIIVGHARFLAAQTLGLVDIPCYVTDLTEKQAKAYRLADNKLNESDWDLQLVLEEIQAIADEGLSAITGFQFTEEFKDLEVVDNVDPEKEWEGMPEFDQSDNKPYRQLIISFENEENVQNFAKLIQQNITPQTRSLWYPEVPRNIIKDKRY